MPAADTTEVSAPPSYFHVPDGAVFTLADEIADVMAALGYTVELPERQVCRALYPQQANGDWAGLESGIAGPRQNIKTTAMIGGAVHDLWVQDVPKVNWTAHEFKTSTETFGEFKRLIETHSWLSRRVKRIRESNGKEGIDLHSGAKLNILARTKRSGRGMGAGRLYGDEALFWTDMQLGAIVPTMSAQRNAHLVHGGSPGMLQSAPWRRLRDRGRSGVDPYLGWIEWGSERRRCVREDCTHEVGIKGCQLDNEDNWWHANPALDRRITRVYVRQERLTLPVVEFMRERMGWWEDPPDEDALTWVDMDVWDGWRDPESRVQPGRLAFGVDTSADRQWTWIAIAGWNAAALPHVELMAVNRGQDWVSSWLAPRLESRKPLGVGIQGGKSPASTLIEPLQNEYGDVIQSLNGVDTARGGMALYDAITDTGIAHIGQEQLTLALRKAVSSEIDPGLLDRYKSRADIAPAIACANALHILLTAPEPEPEPQTYAPRRLRR